MSCRQQRSPGWGARDRRSDPAPVESTRLVKGRRSGSARTHPQRWTAGSGRRLHSVHITVQQIEKSYSVFACCNLIRWPCPLFVSPSHNPSRASVGGASLVARVSRPVLGPRSRCPTGRADSGQTKTPLFRLANRKARQDWIFSWAWRVCKKSLGCAGICKGARCLQYALYIGYCVEYILRTLIAVTIYSSPLI